MAACTTQAQLVQLVSTDHHLDIKQPTHAIQAADCDETQPPHLKAHLLALSHSLRRQLPEIGRLEQLSAAAYDRELDAKKALAVLCGSYMQYFIKSSAVDLGRSTNSLGKVKPRHNTKSAKHKTEQHCILHLPAKSMDAVLHDLIRSARVLAFFPSL